MQRMKLFSLILVGMGAACAMGIVVALQWDYTLLREYERVITGVFKGAIALVVIGGVMGVLAGVVEHFDRKHPRPRLVQEGTLVYDAALEKELRRSWLHRPSPKWRRPSGTKPAPR